MSLTTVMILGLTLPTLPTSADKVDSTLLSRLIEERSRITSWEVVIQVDMSRQKSTSKFADAKFADARWEFHYWRSADGAYRIDRHKVEPKREEDQDHYDNSSFDGFVYRIIDRKDEPYYMHEYRSKKPSYPPELVDPRILDIAAQPMEIIHHYGLQYARRVVDNALDIDIRTQEKPGERVEVYNHPKGLTYIYHFDERNLPTHVTKVGVNTMTPRVRYELEIAYESKLKDAERLPSRIDFTGYEGESDVLKDSITISWLTINREFPKSIYDWASMDPVDDAGLVIDDVYPELPNRSRLIWNGKSFVDRREFDRSRVKKRAPAAAPAWDFGTADVVFWASLNVAAVCLCLWGFRFVRRMRSEPRDA